MIAFRSRLARGIKIMPVKGTEIFWIKPDGRFLNFKMNVFVAVVFGSPANSAVSENGGDIFELFEEDIARYSRGDVIVFLLSSGNVLSG